VAVLRRLRHVGFIIVVFVTAAGGPRLSKYSMIIIFPFLHTVHLCSNVTLVVAGFFSCSLLRTTAMRLRFHVLLNMP
jgi:hypothetical protein